MKNKTFEIAFTEYHYHANGNVTVYFKNCITGMAKQKTYKNAAAAKAQSTMFHNRIARVYSNYKFD